MKNLLIALSLLFSFVGFSQVKNIPEPIQMTKAKLAEVKMITELFQTIKADETVLEVEMVGKVLEQVKIGASTGPDFSQDQLTILKKVDVGSKLYFDYKIKDAKGIPHVHSVAIKVIE